MRPYAFGVDIGGTTVKIGLFKTEGELLEKWEIPTRKENGGEQILPDVAASLKSCMEKRELTPDDVAGVGVAVPGPVRDQSFVERGVNIGWGNKEAAKEMSALLFDLPVKVCNDANAAALGELWRGGASKHNSVVMVTIGTAVGGGVVLDGKIVEGAFGAAGEIGHIPVMDGEEECCGCGKKGCLEQYASATGTVRIAGQLLEQSDAPSALRGIDPLTAKDIYDAAKAGDALAEEAVDTVTRILGKALGAISCVVDPEAFVLGGGTSRAGEYLLERARRYFQMYAFPPSRNAEFYLAELGNDAGIYGAVKMLL